MAKVKVVFITSTAKSGSTLLDLILGSHPDIFGLGEIAQLEKHLPQICGICQSECDYWNRRSSQEILRRQCSQSKGPSAVLREISRYEKSLYAHLAEWFNYEIFVDSSKYPHWIRGQLRFRRHRREISPYLIHITRDGRAVVNSLLRKYPEKGVETISRQWCGTAKDVIKLFDNFDGPKCRVAYEEMSLNPEKTIREICEFLGIQFIPDMLNYWEHEHHNIGGNTGTRSLISQHDPSGAEKPVVNAGARHKGYYQQIGKSIQVDLRWKEEMSPQQLELFEKHAGDLNRLFRYEGDLNDD